MEIISFKNIYVSTRLGHFSVLIFLFLFSLNTYGQVGINTPDPKGVLDVTSINNTGLVLPRVTAIEDVTDGALNAPVNGTTVFDISRDTTCFYLNNAWICIDLDINGNPVLTDVTPGYNSGTPIDYIKASNTGVTDAFGLSMTLSEDGNTLAVGTAYENSNATGINGNQNDDSAQLAGAVYVYVRIAGIWSQQAFIKASNAEMHDRFGYDVSLSHDGNKLAVSAASEASNATGVNGDQTDNSLAASGAVYVFNRTGSTWTQHSYIKASNTNSNDIFGNGVALSGDGNTLAVGTWAEDSNAVGINGNQLDNASAQSGAVYIFILTSNIWSQQAYIKASNTDAGDFFGRSVVLSTNGNTLVVSAGSEDSNATGINGDQTNNAAPATGAVYVFERTGITWLQQAYIKASNPNPGDVFSGATGGLGIAWGRSGKGLSLSSDGNTLVVGAGGEDSNATGINGNQNDNSSGSTGAVYIFVRVGSTWSQEAYIKASNAEAQDFFGRIVELSGDGNTLAVTSTGERSNATGINGDQTDNSIQFSGAVYLFFREGAIWTQHAYVKASNTGADIWTMNGDAFGYCAALSGDGKTLAAGAPLEDSNATGINDDQTDNTYQNSGAVYVYTGN